MANHALAKLDEKRQSSHHYILCSPSFPLFKFCVTIQRVIIFVAKFDKDDW